MRKKSTHKTFNQTGLLQIQRQLRQMGNGEIAEHSHRFFKTGKGQYGEGDKFIGIRVPAMRKLARQYRGLSTDIVIGLLRSPVHEERLLALFILVDAFKRASLTERELIYKMYIDNTQFINNWDLVDSSAEHIVGAYLRTGDKTPLYNLALSDTLWERRIAIMATFHFIKHHEFDETLKIAQILLKDEEDLIHKAVGWMLREVGKRNVEVEEQFLKKHYTAMPRCMLRYAIERFPEDKRAEYLRR